MKNAEKKEPDKTAVSNSEAESADLLQALDQFSQPAATIPSVNAADDGDSDGKSYYVLKLPDAEPSGLSAEDIKYNHLKFHLTGTADDKAQHRPALKELIPALSAPFLDTEQLRYDFPVIINNGKQWVLPLKDFIDTRIQKSSLNSDEKGHLQRALLKLEVLIKKFSIKNPVSGFKETWQKSVKTLLDSQNSKSLKKDIIKDTLNAISETITPDAQLIAFAAENALQLIGAARLFNWYKLMSPYEAELEELTLQLNNILQSGVRNSENKYSAEALHDTMGKTGEEEVDFNSLSEIVSESFKKEVLPGQRIKRIQDVLSVLNKWIKILASTANTEKYLNNLDTDSTQKALSLYQKQKEELIEFFKALRIARLEKEHRYDESKHDSFFSEFSSLYLSEDEWACFPPIFLHFTASKIKNSDKSDLIDILSSRMPIKIMMLVDDLYNSTAIFDESFYSPGWPAVLGKMALGLNNCFVLQFPLSHTVQVDNEIEQGILFNGPALYSVFDGFDQAQPVLDPYLRSASASESRAFPLFSFSPVSGKTWAESFSIEKSSQYEFIWPSGVIALKDGDKNEELKIRYCLADFLSGIERYHSHFMPVNQSEWHNEMVSLPDYIDPDFKNSDNSVPFISMADKNGNMYRVIVTKTLCNLCLNAKNLWRNLQELGGINNSHVQKQVTQEIRKIEDQMKAEIEKVKSGHEAEMERTVEDLTNEIISNIAAGLLSDEMISIGSGAVAAAPARPEPQVDTKNKSDNKKEPKETEKTTVEEEDEEDMAFNEPYIDTPLCTSCNDCMNVNSQIFAYDENKQAYIKDAKAGTFKDLVTAAEKCPVKIIHPGKPLNPDEPGLDELVKIAEKYN